ncbi:MAG TPA: hypothetical protein DCM86_06265 [Verrucomicrobiales bacterium]|nr:hypothetical protein [Verrucomicrobiales bacterium]
MVMHVLNAPPRAVPRHRRGGMLTTELIVALALLGALLIPMSFGFLLEGKLLRRAYVDAVAMEILDGEMEVLAAGNWQRFSPGEHLYLVTAAATTNLPPGRFLLTRSATQLRLEWRPDPPGRSRPQSREVRLP